MSDGWPGDETREQTSSLADEARDLRKQLAVANTTIANLRDALGICHAVMERHDNNSPWDEHPAGTCLVDFEAEREIAMKVLTLIVKNSQPLGFCNHCEKPIHEGQEYVVDHTMMCMPCFKEHGWDSPWVVPKMPRVGP